MQTVLRSVIARAVVTVLCGAGCYASRGVDSGGALVADAGPAVDDAASDVATFDDPFVLALEVADCRGDPFPRVPIRVDQSDGSVLEGATDGDGRIRLTVDRAAAPWTVTAARAGHGATTILGVTGPLRAPLHLSRCGGPPASGTRAIGGAVTGLGAWRYPVLQGPDLLTTSVWTDGFEGSIRNRGPAALRLLALDWDRVDTRSPPPINGVWIEVDGSVSDLIQVDIAFPSPARTLVTSEFRIELPVSGAVDGRGLPEPSYVSVGRRVDGFRYEVGTATETDRAEGRRTFTVQGLDGDLAPTEVLVQLVGDTDAAFVGGPVSSQTVIVPAAEELTFEGTTLEDVRVWARGSAFTHVGASVTVDGGANGAWYVYTYGPAELSELRWPALPAGLRAEDVASGGEARLNVFAGSTPPDVPIWDWPRSSTQGRALTRSGPIRFTGR